MDDKTGNLYTSYIAASYVKFMESGGARVVPIMINQTEEYYRGVVNAVNGLVFPGGSSSFRSLSSGYGRAGSLLYNLVREAKEMNDTEIPLFATCLGFEMLLYLDANKINPLSRCNASNLADPLNLSPDFEQTEILGSASQDVLNTLTTTNSTSNFHKYCVTPQRFNELDLQKNYTIVSTSFDREKDDEYISTVEHKRLPIYGTQWHPEKNSFEWAFSSIPHSREAIRAAQYFANFFVEKARQNNIRYSTAESRTFPLIYNYKPTYIRLLYKSSFQQCYFFK